MDASICPGSGAVEVVRVGVPFSRVPLVRESRLGGIACFKCASLTTCQRNPARASFHSRVALSQCKCCCCSTWRAPATLSSICRPLFDSRGLSQLTRLYTCACQLCHCVYVCVQLAPLSFSAPTSLDAISLLIIAPIELFHCR